MAPNNQKHLQSMLMLPSTPVVITQTEDRHFTE